MKKEHLKYLVCPSCKGSLILLEVDKENNGSIEKGIIQCSTCKKQFDIVLGIPRFVSSENYAHGFGFEWKKHAITQYDSFTGVNVSETRFFKETKWSRHLNGQFILEVGSGSGRFTEIAASTGAMVVSMDYSYAVEANYASNGSKDNVLIVQADIYHMPFKENFFDKLLCIGVLQHTPNVEKSFKSLPSYLKSGGNMVIDIYRRRTGISGLIVIALTSKYWIRSVTKEISTEKLYRLCEQYVKLMWPVAKQINKIPYIGRQINRKVFCISDHRGQYGLSEDMLKEWAILGTFDMLSPAYDYPQTIETIQRWFRESDMVNIEVHPGQNGIEGRGTKNV